MRRPKEREPAPAPWGERRADCNRRTEMNRAADRQPIHGSRRVGIWLQVAVFFNFPAAPLQCVHRFRALLEHRVAELFCPRRILSCAIMSRTERNGSKASTQVVGPFRGIPNLVPTRGSRQDRGEQRIGIQGDPGGQLIQLRGHERNRLGSRGNDCPTRKIRVGRLPHTRSVDYRAGKGIEPPAPVLWVTMRRRKPRLINSTPKIIK